MNNKLTIIQDMLFSQMKRLDDNELIIKGLGKREIQRSGALSQSASAFLKSVNTSLKIKEMTKMNPASEKTILKELGVLIDEQ